MNYNIVYHHMRQGMAHRLDIEFSSRDNCRHFRRHFFAERHNADRHTAKRFRCWMQHSCIRPLWIDTSPFPVWQPCCSWSAFARICQPFQLGDLGGQWEDHGRHSPASCTCFWKTGTIRHDACRRSTSCPMFSDVSSRLLADRTCVLLQRSTQRRATGVREWSASCIFRGPFVSDDGLPERGHGCTNQSA